jgi:hypothetical protein
MMRMPPSAGSLRCGLRALDCGGPAANSSPVGLVGQRGRSSTTVRLAVLSPHIRSPGWPGALLAARSQIL